MTPPLNWVEMYQKILHEAINAKKITLTHGEVRFVFGPYTKDGGEESFSYNPDLWAKITPEIQDELRAVWDGEI